MKKPSPPKKTIPDSPELPKLPRPNYTYRIVHPNSTTPSPSQATGKVQETGKGEIRLPTSSSPHTKQSKPNHSQEVTVAKPSTKLQQGMATQPSVQTLPKKAKSEASSTKPLNPQPSPKTAVKTAKNPPHIKKKTPSGKKGKGKKNYPFWVKGLAIGAGLTCLASVAMVTGAFLAMSLNASPLQKTPFSETSRFFKREDITRQNLRFAELTRPVNIVILGTKVLTSDLPETYNPKDKYLSLVNSFKGLSDTMMLVRFDPTTKKVTVLSIPRDTKASIEGVGVKKINEANYYGGAGLAAQTISQTLGGVQVDRYIRVNVQGVEKLIDALGGVNMYVPRDMKYQDDSQHLYINLKKGQQHLDGNKALQLLRFRYDEYGDIGRVQRQQAFMRSLIEQTLKPATIVQLPDILRVIQDHIDTDLSVEEIIALTGFASKINRQNTQMLMLPGMFSGDGRHEISYWLPNERRIKSMMAQHFGLGVQDVKETSPSRVYIAIQDSINDPKAVQSLVKHLQGLGYTQVVISKPWSPALEETRLIAQQGDDGMVSELRAKLGFGDVRVDSTGVLYSDVTIQLGRDWKDKLQQLSP